MPLRRRSPFRDNPHPSCRLAAGEPAAIGNELEVTVRTIYRDVATLQARRIPIDGAAGIGYVLRRGNDCRGYEVLSRMFTEDEAEAIALWVRLLARTGAPGCPKRPLRCYALPAGQRRTPASPIRDK